MKSDDLMNISLPNHTVYLFSLTYASTLNITVTIIPIIVITAITIIKLSLDLAQLYSQAALCAFKEGHMSAVNWSLCISPPITQA